MALKAILFFTLFHEYHFRGTKALSSNGEIFFLVCLLVLFVYLRGLWGVVEPYHRMPTALQLFLLALVTTTVTGLMGVLSNTVVRTANDGFMPVSAAYKDEVSPYESHCLTTENNVSSLFVDGVYVDNSKEASFLFPNGKTYISAGDLVSAASIGLAWWIALGVVLWATAYAIKMKRGT